MKKLKLKASVKKLTKMAEKHAPTILTVIGCTGLVATVIFTVKATPVCEEILEERRGRLEDLDNQVNEDGSEIDEKTRKEEVFKINTETGVKLIKAAGPAVVSFGTTMLCIIGSNVMSLRRLSDISAAYDLSQTALKKYKEKTKEVIGDKKEREINEAIFKDVISDGNGYVIETGHGDTYIYDAVSGRLFKHNKLAIEKKIVDLNNQLFGDMFVSLNEFYQSIDLMPISLGEYLGFNVEDGMINVTWTTMEAPINGIDEPCWVMDYDISRRHRFGDDY